MGNKLDHEIPTTVKCHPIVELRQYTLYPGKRDVLIELFEREFIQPQEAAGVQVIGQFHDLDNPDRFVWLRGFPDMPSRAESLNTFYNGEVWKEHRDAANATMIDSDNVLLLRILEPASGFDLAKQTMAERGVLVAMIFYFDSVPDGPSIELVERTLTNDIVTAGARNVASFITEQSSNNFPRLPVREGENVYVRLIHFPGSKDSIETSRRWQSEIVDRFLDQSQLPDVLRLLPTARSLVPVVY